MYVNWEIIDNAVSQHVNAISLQIISSVSRV